MDQRLQQVTYLPVDESAEYLSEERCHILELSNREDDPAVSIARARVAPGVSTRPHSLDGTDERYLILAGQGLATIGEEPPRLLTPGDVVLIPPGMSQQIENTGGEDLVFLCICTPRFRWENYRALD
jgi:mannose-6-phosphate isomerase-like protein (cupin superfamily)